MQAWGRWFSIGSIAMFALACGSKGSDDAAGGAAAGGAAAGGAAAGGTEAVAGSPSAGESSGGSSTAGMDGAGGSGEPLVYPFDTDLQTWKLEYTSSGTYGPPATPMTAPKILEADVGVAWTNMEGNPATPPGAIKVSIPYATPSQYVGVGISLPVGVDLTDKIIRAKVKVLSGLGDPVDLMTNPGGAKLYVKTGVGYVYAAGTFTNLNVIGSWIAITFDLTAPSFVAMSEAGTFDPKDVREIGIQFDTGSTTTTPMPAVELIDSVTY